ncbi:sigma-54 dependent transcriptional regulator [Geobacter sp. SVR]|uniref:sigma-54-dependent transcriptional regulator n=1 Tax=Geobacter sp. SVR TaxID=2495594 RepID=UPI00143EFDAC|nr:sigma-54 dependent transcriptional regulator [Geobacter sp. SVR]BCS54388.1 Fis family transcriptional regulator [Geobacter sp. SVR]GCF87443.1 Fis family transcriptional regulator [Geobacter sp. SVR]
MERISILVVDDEAVIREGLKRILDSGRFAVEACQSGQRAIELLQEHEFDLIVTDLKMPGMNGIEVLTAVKTLQPDVPVIMITGYASVDTAVEAMKCGAVDYITKPFTPEQFLEKLERALEQRHQLLDEMYLKKEISSHHGFNRFVGESKEMQKVYRRIIQVAATTSTVLITGESGTGKELVARAIHDNGPRREQPFVAVDCSALAENLLESELFGHVKGSFTGAVQTKVGLFKVADGGTLFLDEVSNISLSTQAKLLRAFQERQITPIGGTQPVPINIHLIAATNRNLRTMVGEGAFREDLFFRLNVIPIDLPPLRERKGDVPLLIQHFLRRFSVAIGKEIRGVAPDAMAMLEAYAYPGNVREVENIIERAVVLAEGDIISREDLDQFDSAGGNEPRREETFFGARIPVTAEELKEMKRHIRGQAVEEIEKAFLISALKRNNCNVTKAAEETGILRTNFQGMLKRLGISSRTQMEL